MFEEDLKRGKLIGKSALREIHEIEKDGTFPYEDAYIVEGEDKRYDIYIPSLKKGVEVKFDEKSLETDNIFIEVSYNGKDSGLRTTEAAQWWIFHDGAFIVTSPARLRDLIARYKLKPKKLTIQGKEVEAYLIMVSLVIYNAIEIRMGDL